MNVLSTTQNTVINRSRRGFLASLLASGLVGCSRSIAVTDESTEEKLRRLLPDWPAEDIQALAEKFGNTAVNVTREFGERGARAILIMGYRGVALIRQQPEVFKAISDCLDSETAIRFLALFGERIFDLGSSLAKLPHLLRAGSKLPGRAQAWARKYPATLIYLVVSPEKMVSVLEKHHYLGQLCLLPINLEFSVDKLDYVIDLIDKWADKAKDWIRVRGLDGLLLAEAFPSLVKAVPPVELPVYLGLISENRDYIEQLLTRREGQQQFENAIRLLKAQEQYLPDEVYNLEDSHIPPATKDTLWQVACRDSATVEFLVEFGTQGAELLRLSLPQFVATGVSLPDLIINGFEYRRRPNLAKNALHALERAFEHGQAEVQTTYEMFLVLTSDPDAVPPIGRYNARVKNLLEKLDWRVVPYLSALAKDANKYREGIEKLEDRGTDELEMWQHPTRLEVQLLPGYDAVFLLWLLSRGYRPTLGETVFGAIDIAFTGVDLIACGLPSKAVKAAAKGGRITVKQLRNLVENSLDNMARNAAKNKVLSKWGKEAIRQAVLTSLEKTPKVLRAVARYGVTFEWNVMCAWRAAKKLAIILSALSTRIALYIAKEWAIGYGAVQSISAMIRAAQENAIEVEIWVKKLKELLESKRLLDLQLAESDRRDISRGSIRERPCT